MSTCASLLHKLSSRKFGWTFMYRVHVSFLRNRFSKASSMFLKISSIWAPEMFLISFGSHHHLKMATYGVHSFVCFFYISSKLNLFSCRDGVYSLSMILSVCFDVKKTLRLKHLWFNSAVAFVFVFFSIS